MRDFSDTSARPFSLAKQDDLVSVVRDILSGKGNPSTQNIVPETEEEEDEKGKPRVVKNAIKRIKNKKKKERETQDGN